MSPHVRRRSALAMLALFTASCTDVPTAPRAEVPQAARSSQAATPSSSASFNAATPYTCFTSIATPGGQHAYRYGRLQLHFPTSALAPDGSATTYIYRGYANGAVLDRLASCVIPRTREAVQMMNRRFGVSQPSGKNGSSGGEIGIMGDGDAVQIPPIEVTACEYGGFVPDCKPKPAPQDPSYPLPPSWGEPGGGPRGGNSALPGDDDNDGDTLNNGPAAFALCVAGVMGIDGGFAAIGVGVAIYEMFNAKVATRSAWHQYASYVTKPGADPEISNVYLQLYKNAESSEATVLAAAVLATGYTGAKLGYAAATCAPLWAAPV